MSWRLSGAILVAAALTGCAGLEQVRNSEPVRSEVFAGNYKDLATCIVLAWNGRTNGLYGLVVDEKNQRAFITPHPTLMGGAPEETTVAQLASGKVSVELRQAPVLISGADYAWRDVRICAQDGAT